MSKTTIERLSGMTVADLIETLRQFNQEAIVAFTSDYGDRSHTQQVHGVGSVEPVGEEQLYETPYSDSGVAVREFSYEDEPETAKVVVLTSDR